MSILKRQFENFKKLRIMKKLFFFILLLFALLTEGCLRDEFYGSGHIITEERNLKNFDGIKVQGAMEVHLVQDNRFRVLIEADDLLIDHVETYISNGVLVVKMTNGYNYAGQNVVLWVHAPDVYEINLDGSGLIVTDNRHDFDDYLEINLSGSGSIDIRGSARTTDIDLSGSGDIRLTGSGTFLNIKTSGSGEVRAFDFNVDEADIETFGSGNMYINTWRYLVARINGSGDIIYEGNPRIDAYKYGSGNLRRR
jgi:Putative auto-transporter adhesin, head GIN domain